MAFNPAPSHWIAGWASDGTNLTIPIASIPQLSAAEANATTGDIRKALFALFDAFYQASQAQAAGDLPVNMKLNKGQSLNNGTGQITATYSATFVLTPGSIEVSPES